MSHRLRVNPITCQAHGVCAELFPEWITLEQVPAVLWTTDTALRFTSSAGAAAFHIESTLSVGPPLS